MYEYIYVHSYTKCPKVIKQSDWPDKANLRKNGPLLNDFLGQYIYFTDITNISTCKQLN